MVWKKNYWLRQTSDWIRKSVREEHDCNDNGNETTDEINLNELEQNSESEDTDIMLLFVIQHVILSESIPNIENLEKYAGKCFPKKMNSFCINDLFEKPLTR